MDSLVNQVCCTGPVVIELYQGAKAVGEAAEQVSIFNNVPGFVYSLQFLSLFVFLK